MISQEEFEGALEMIFNEYKLTDGHLANMDGQMRLDFARHVARRLREVKIGLHALKESDDDIAKLDAQLAKSDAFLKSLLDPNP